MVDFGVAVVVMFMMAFTEFGEVKGEEEEIEEEIREEE
jgi:hypothetical protein